MVMAKRRSQPGLIYCQESLNSDRKGRAKAGSIKVCPPMRSTSVGKILSRPITHQAKKSISIQTDDFLELLQKKVSFTSPQVNKIAENRGRQQLNWTKNSQQNFLKIANQNIAKPVEPYDFAKTLKKINIQDHQVQKPILMKTRENKIPKQQILKNKISKQDILKMDQKSKNQQCKQNIAPLITSGTDRKGYKNRTQKISEMTALYEKNLAKYQTAKGVLGNLLQEEVKK